MARKKANTKADIQSAFRATGLIPFDPDHVLQKLKVVKPYTPRSITSSNQAFTTPEPPITIPRVTIQQGTATVTFPIRKHEEANQWIEKLSTERPSLPQYKAKLLAFIQCSQRVRRAESTLSARARLLIRDLDISSVWLVCKRFIYLPNPS